MKKTIIILYGLLCNAQFLLAQYPIELYFKKYQYDVVNETYQAIKKKIGFDYRKEHIDTIACALSQLALPEKAIHLNIQYDTFKQDTVQGMSAAIFKFINAAKNIFQVNSSTIQLESFEKKHNIYQIIFKRNYYQNIELKGRETGRLEFMINTDGDILMMNSTMSAERTFKITDKLISEDVAKQTILTLYDKPKGIDVNFEISNPKKILEFKGKKLYVKRKTEIVMQKNFPVNRLVSETFYVVYEFLVEIANLRQRNRALFYVDAVTAEIISIDEVL